MHCEIILICLNFSEILYGLTRYDLQIIQDKFRVQFEVFKMKILVQC
jgi:hypothetical protein